jgi:AcrR family transcriptional regulator
MRAEPKRQERGRRRIELILDAAEQVFGDVGFAAATTNLIATRAGISPGSLYQFFANKQAIAEALASRYVALMAEMQDAALDPSLAELSLPELVDRAVDPMIEFNLAHPAAKSLLHATDASPTLAASTAVLHEALLLRVEALIEARTPELPAANRALVATVSTQIFKALLPTVLAAKPRDRAAVIAELKAALVGYWASVESPERSHRV